METYDEAWMDGMLAFQSSLYLLSVFIYLYIILGDIAPKAKKKGKDTQSVRKDDQ